VVREPQRQPAADAIRVRHAQLLLIRPPAAIAPPSSPVTPDEMPVAPDADR
jgi:hypothetical protein